MNRKKIEFSNSPIQKIFSDFFIIPEYQREYVWDEKNILQLLNDIHSQFDFNSESEYFLGSIVVCKNENDHKLEVIDGQQRLITLSLILSRFIKIYSELGESISSIEKLLNTETITETGENVKSYIIDLKYEGKDVLYDLYHKTEEELDPTIIEGLPGKTIFDASKTIKYFFIENYGRENVYNLAELKKFLGFILNKVILITIETPDIGNALKIFETINERGVGLDQVDLLKNLLFIQVSRSDFIDLKDRWNKFKDIINGKKIKEKPLRFLRYYIMANYQIEKNVTGEAVIREDDIYDWFSSNEKLCGYKTDPKAFVRNIHENAEFYINILKCKYNSENSAILNNISKLVGRGFKQHLILILSAKDFSIDQFNHFIAQIETLLFYYNITKEPPRAIEKRFALWSNEIKNIKSDEELNDFIVHRLQTDINNRKLIYERNFMSLEYKSLQKYKLKYILAKLSQYVDKMRLGEFEHEEISSYLKSTIQIEHILPDTPTDLHIQDFGKTVEEYHIFKNKLGNLALLERPINASIKRDFYEQKRIPYSSSIFYLTRSISKFDEGGKETSITRTNSKLKSFEEWDSQSIDLRHQILFNLSKELWSIKLI